MLKIKKDYYDTLKYFKRRKIFFGSRINNRKKRKTEGKSQKNAVVIRTYLRYFNLCPWEMFARSLGDTVAIRTRTHMINRACVRKCERDCCASVRNHRFIVLLCKS